MARSRRKTTGRKGHVGTVGPIDIGANGVLVDTGDRRWLVPSAVPGARVCVLQAARRQAPRTKRNDGDRDVPPAEVTATLVPAPNQIAAPCGVLERCGGCAVQGLAYEQQLEQKHASLVEKLSALNVPRSRVAPVRGLSRPFGHRTRLLMPAFGSRGGVLFGFYRRNSQIPTQAHGCPVQHPLTLAALAWVKQACDAQGVEPTTVEGGWLHGVQIRVDPATETWECMLLGRDEHVDGALIAALRSLPSLTALHLNLQPSRSSYMLGERFMHIGGSRRFSVTLCGRRFKLSPGTFLQNSLLGAELLIDTVSKLLPAEIDCLADLYGGAGIISRCVAPRWRKAIVAESNPHAVADAEAAAKDMDGLTVVPGSVEDTIDQVLAANPDMVIVDPPRKGLHQQVADALGQSATGSLVYIACGATAFIRDAHRLASHGFEIDAVESVDLFPHTPHLEIVARFVRR